MPLMRVETSYKCRSRLHHGEHTMESDGPQQRALPQTLEKLVIVGVDVVNVVDV